MQASTSIPFQSITVVKSEACWLVWHFWATFSQRQRLAFRVVALFQLVFHEKTNTSHEFSVPRIGQPCFHVWRSLEPRPFEQYLEWTETAPAWVVLTVEAANKTHRLPRRISIATVVASHRVLNDCCLSSIPLSKPRWGPTRNRLCRWPLHTHRSSVRLAFPWESAFLFVRIFFKKKKKTLIFEVSAEDLLETTRFLKIKNIAPPIPSRWCHQHPLLQIL